MKDRELPLFLFAENGMRERRGILIFKISKKGSGYGKKVCFVSLRRLSSCGEAVNVLGFGQLVFQIRKDKRQKIDNKNHGRVRRGKIKTNV